MLRFALTIITIIVFSASASEGKVYRWVTEDGRVIFSDQPVPGAKPIDLTAKVQNVTESVKPKEFTIPTNVTSQNKAIQLSFSDIEDQATVRSATGDLTVTAYISIQIGVTQKLQLLLDGTPVGESQSGMVFKLSGIERGEHTLQLKLLNTIGDVLSSSQTITFYMHRPSRLN